MKKSYVNILMVILFSTTLVSFSYAGSSCCPGAGCCDTTNISVSQQQLRAPLTGTAQTKLGTVKKPAPQINPMTWSATVNQIGNPQGITPGTGCCPGTNTTNGCCGSEPQAALHPRPVASAITDIFAFNTFLGTLW
jgi:hypothetical protein